MKIKEAKKLIKLIKDIYAGKEFPEKFAEATGRWADYLAQLYPPEDNKLIGDWILSQFELKHFLDVESIKEYSAYISEELKSVLFFSNLPTKDKFLDQIKELEDFNDVVESNISLPAQEVKR